MIRTRSSILSLIGLSILPGCLLAQSPSLILEDGGIRFPDSTILSSAAGSYANVVVVAKSGGHYTSIQVALDSITDASQSNPYLVWIAPGVYTEEVTMKPWVDLQGSGQNVTRITSSGETVYGANDAELRYLTVESTGETAIYNASRSPRLSHLTVIASGSGCRGVKNSNADPEMSHLTVNVSGTSSVGVYNDRAQPRMTDCVITASGDSSSGMSNFAARPKMTHLTVTAYGGGTCHGVHNHFHASPTMTQVTVEAACGLYAKAVWNQDSSPTMIDVTATASADLYSWGVHSTGASATRMTGASVAASGGTYNFGVYLENESSLEAHHSVVRASDGLSPIAIGGEAGASARIAASLLDGDIGGSFCTCVGAYDGLFAPLGEDCKPPPSP